MHQMCIRDSTGLLEYKNVYRPVRVVSYDKESGELVLHNYMDFDDLKDYVKISYELTQDGLVISKGILPEFSVAPHGEGKTNLKINVPENGKCYFCLLYTSTEEIERTKNLLEARRVISITSGGRVKINTGLFVEFMLQKNGGRE